MILRECERIVVVFYYIKDTQYKSLLLLSLLYVEYTLIYIMVNVCIIEIIVCSSGNVGVNIALILTYTYFFSLPVMILPLMTSE